MIYLAADGNWGDATNLLIFNVHDLPEDLYQAMAEDPEGTYDDVREWILNNDVETR